MKTIVPQNDSVLCICMTEKTKTTEFGFVYESNDVPLYKVVSISKNAKDNNLSLEEGDIVRTNSTGTPITLDGVDYTIFKIENIMGKIA